MRVLDLIREALDKKYLVGIARKLAKWFRHGRPSLLDRDEFFSNVKNIKTLRFQGTKFDMGAIAIDLSDNVRVIIAPMGETAMLEDEEILLAPIPIMGIPDGILSRWKDLFPGDTGKSFTVSTGTTTPYVVNLYRDPEKLSKDLNSLWKHLTIVSGSGDEYEEATNALSGKTRSVKITTFDIGGRTEKVLSVYAESDSGNGYGDVFFKVSRDGNELVAELVGMEFHPGLPYNRVCAVPGDNMKYPLLMRSDKSFGISYTPIYSENLVTWVDASRRGLVKEWFELAQSFAGLEATGFKSKCISFDLASGSTKFNIRVITPFAVALSGDESALASVARRLKNYVVMSFPGSSFTIRVVDRHDNSPVIAPSDPNGKRALVNALKQDSLIMAKDVYSAILAAGR